MSDRFQILSLDGGGFKGLFSAAVLSHFEQDLNIHITDHFDLIVGTSTGGIIALGLGLGMSPREIVHFYTGKGHRIFGGKWPFISKFIHNFHRYYKAKFNPLGLKSALQDCFGDKVLHDSKKRLVIPSYNIDSDDIYLFKTPHHENFTRDLTVPIWANPNIRVMRGNKV